MFVPAASWEERRTASGRIQYLNHITRTTQWERPNRWVHSAAHRKSNPDLLNQRAAGRRGRPHRRHQCSQDAVGCSRRFSDRLFQTVVFNDVEQSGESQCWQERVEGLLFPPFSFSFSHLYYSFLTSWTSASFSSSTFDGLFFLVSICYCL